MTDFLESISKIIQLYGGELVGKTRLQKSAYFLERFGVGFGFDFEYHHYGPYSDELSIASDDANALGIVNIEWSETKSGNSFAIFRSGEVPVAEDENDERREKIIDKLRHYNSIDLELAATSDFLKNNGYPDDPWAEVKVRKATKSSPGRIESAQRLLAELEAL
jgi:uncharacterized protein YwgA